MLGMVDGSGSHNSDAYTSSTAAIKAGEDRMGGTLNFPVTSE